MDKAWTKHGQKYLIMDKNYPENGGKIIFS